MWSTVLRKWALRLKFSFFTVRTSQSKISMFQKVEKPATFLTACDSMFHLRRSAGVFWGRTDEGCRRCLNGSDPTIAFGHNLVGRSSPHSSAVVWSDPSAAGKIHIPSSLMPMLKAVLARTAISIRPQGRGKDVTSSFPSEIVTSSIICVLLSSLWWRLWWLGVDGWSEWWSLLFPNAVILYFPVHRNGRGSCANHCKQQIWNCS